MTDIGYRLKHNDSVLATWTNIPEKFDVPGVGTVHAASPGWSSGEFSFEQYEKEPPPPAPIMPAQIQMERERRLALGFDYAFGDGRGTHRIGTSPQDMTGWDEVSKIASALVARGLGSQAINIVTDTGPVQVTALEWQDILIAAGAFRQPIWAKSFVLQSMSTIPSDYMADAYWV